MKTDLYGQLIFNQNDLCELFLQDPTRTITNALVDTAIEFNGFLSLENTPNLTQYQDPNILVEEFDRINQSKVGINKNCFTSIKNRGTLELNFLRKTCLLKKLSIRKREISTSAKVK